ncbi:MAG: hemerythrin domain-containing protein [Candidatus Symbiothrix sp.]|jgi:regulator of cell morphogenesis and NO signaling|nr:hemerythrin domain-containing protein [Candidatus Symbiothrix sp.]
MQKFRIGNYQENDSMSRLVSENYGALLVMSRFEIALGFGDKSIGEVCRDSHVDTNTFLSVINMSDNDFSLEALMDYLHRSHDYFLKYQLPDIRRKLALVLNVGQDELNKAVLGYFDKFEAEMRKHMNYEDKKVFPYVKALLKHEKTEKCPLIFSKQHEQIETRLTEFKNILIKYYPAQSTNEMNSVLFDIFNSEYDFESHNAVEDQLFLPAIHALERKNEQPA